MTALRDWAARGDWAATLRIAEPAPGSAGSEHEHAAHVSLRVGAERQRIALALHDEVAPLLFAMASRVRRTLADNAAEPDGAQLLATLQTLEKELRTTQGQLRGVICECGPVEPVEAVPAATQRDVEAFTERTGVAAHLVVRGQPCHLPAVVERVALNCLRQALVNVERHANATLAVVTLDYRRDRLCLVVQDDGLGLPAGFEPRAVPVDGHWGFTSMAEQVERLGGSVLLRQADEGGTQLRIELPVP
ncbi:MAG: histidine kinase [Actinomycetota bacterium]|nr:histidine kinase [Actinomycetota bacterium]